MLYPRRPSLAQVLLPLSFYFKLNFTTNQKNHPQWCCRFGRSHVCIRPTPGPKTNPGNVSAFHVSADIDKYMDVALSIDPHWSFDVLFLAN